MFKKLFKKKKVEEIKKEYTYSAFMKNGEIIKCVGKGISMNDLAGGISNLLESYENIFITGEDGSKHVIWSKDVYKIVID